jgi:ABC-2 type transport system ATP-binding protein
MTAPSPRPVRTRIGRKGGVAERKPGVAATPGRTGDDRPRAPIRTRGLTKNYGDLVAVDRLDLEVHAGEIFGLLGQNGAGKTTTILMLLGLTEPTEGQARVVGLDPARRPLEVKRRVGYLPDAVGFYGDLTGRQNLRYTAALNRIPRGEAEATIDEVLEQVGLSSRADDRTDTYSRGMLQRLGIADALVKDPDVLILDEPTTAIDPLGVTEILDLLRSLVRERDMAILLSSHLLNQVQHVCDRIGIFSFGRLIGQGTMDELAGKFGEDVAHIELAFAFDEPSAASAAEGVVRGIDGVRPSAARRPQGPVARHRRGPEPRRPGPHAIIRASLEHEYPLVSVRSVQPSLEDIYRRAVARTRRPDGAVA